MAEKHQLAWLAGLIDGDGSFQLVETYYVHKGNKRPVIKVKVSIINTNELIINMCCELIEELTGSKAYIYVQKAKEENWKDRKQIILTKKSQIVLLIKAIYPFIVGKKEQAEIVLNFCLRDNIQYNEADWEKVQRIKILNTRGDGKMPKLRKPSSPVTIRGEC